MVFPVKKKRLRSIAVSAWHPVETGSIFFQKKNNNWLKNRWSLMKRRLFRLSDPE
jgi:hypothetical protein